MNSTNSSVEMIAGGGLEGTLRALLFTARLVGVAREGCWTLSESTLVPGMQHERTSTSTTNEDEKDPINDEKIHDVSSAVSLSSRVQI